MRGLALALALLNASAAFAASARSLVKQGNQAYQSEDYDGAVEAYTQAASEDPESPAAAFNRGAALYRQERFGDAIPAFNAAAEIAREAGDEELEAFARYNLGNAFVRRAERHRATDPQTAVASLENAIRSYRQAARPPAGMHDAAHNLELAKRALREILDEMRNQPQSGGQQQQDQQQQELADQLREQIRRQEQLNQEREQLEQQPRNEQRQQRSQQLARQQEELEQRARETAEQMEQQAQQQPSPEQRQRNRQAQQSMEQAAEQQRRAAEQIKDEQLARAEQPQQQALSRMRQALDQLQGGEAQQPQQQAQGDPMEQQPQGNDPVSQALETTPEDLLDEERRYRNRRRELTHGRMRKVDKDW